MTASNSVSDRRRRRVTLAGLAAALLAVLLSAAIGDSLSRSLFDDWQKISPRDMSDMQVEVVLIDAESIAALGPWPWPRYHLARLIERLAAARPLAIGFDTLFPEPDRIRPDIFTGFYPELSPAAVAEIGRLESMDRLFGKVVARAPVVLGRAAVDSGGVDPATMIVDPVWQGPLPPDLRSWPRAIGNIPELEQTALSHGLLNGRPDTDGRIRRVPLLMRVGTRAMPGFAFELARAGAGVDQVRLQRGVVHLGTHSIPIDDQGRIALHFGTIPASHLHSAVDVLRRHLPVGLFAGKIVVIGLAAEGTADIVATPLAVESYGVLVQAQAVDAILRGGWLVRPLWVSMMEWGAGGGLALLGMVLVFLAHPGRFVIPLGVAFGLLAGAWIAFTSASLLFDPIRPLMIGGFTMAGMLAAIAIEARSERERLRETLVRERVDTAATEGELQAARTIQRGMLPSRDSLAGFDRRVDIDALLEPAKSVGGDFFDIVRLDEDRLAFVIADVTGKGVPAALFMALSKALTKSVMLRGTADLAEVASRLNTELSRDNAETMGVTMVIGLLDLTTGQVAMVNAGHEDPLHVCAGGDVVVHKLEGGPPFCVVDYPYPAETMTLRPGEALVLVTDGVTEAQDKAGGLFGIARVVETVTGETAAAMVEALRAAVREFEAGGEASDDLTVMVVRYLGERGVRGEAPPQPLA